MILIFGSATTAQRSKSKDRSLRQLLQGVVPHHLGSSMKLSSLALALTLLPAGPLLADTFERDQA
ncbi:hypothetical protein, partial [Pseudomonas sp. HY7a-MNA-CIBAN-0227]|uniref:hypothetical protein n=1 Tax=Pseudomonas sp. HY7a-MNA-CIBAN-0227 TaxID=3140474 RepID=UPI00332C97A8